MPSLCFVCYRVTDQIEREGNNTATSIFAIQEMLYLRAEIPWSRGDYHATHSCLKKPVQNERPQFRGFGSVPRPNSLNNRLTQGECMPVSRAIRLCGIAPNTSFMVFGVALSLCSSRTLPAASSTQYQLERSPRSRPIVSFCSEKLLFCFTYLLCLEHVITWERTASRRRPAFSSHLLTIVHPLTASNTVVD
jgi:hypothetical protein